MVCVLCHHTIHIGLDFVLLQAEHADGAEFDCSDNNVYFVKAGTMQMRAMDKLLAGRQAETVVAETAASAPTMAASGPLSKVSTLFCPLSTLCSIHAPAQEHKTWHMQLSLLTLFTKQKAACLL